jgi:hypothetical protein
MMRIAIFVFLGLSSLTQAEEMGRLFFNRDERNKIDQLHMRQSFSEDVKNDSSVIIVNGLIQRSNGSRTAWINGKARHDAPGKNTNAVPLTLPGKSGSIEVKVGQRLLLDNLPSSAASAPASSIDSN